MKILNVITVGLIGALGFAALACHDHDRVVVRQTRTVVVEQPAPPPPVVVQQPAPVIVQQPAPVIVEQAPAQVIVQQAPPAVIVETPPPPPSTLHVWIGGYYTYVDRHYTWVRGHYYLPPSEYRGFSWSVGVWVKDSHGYRYQPGHWNRPGGDRDNHGRDRVPDRGPDRGRDGGPDRGRDSGPRDRR